MSIILRNNDMLVIVSGFKLLQLRRICVGEVLQPYFGKVFPSQSRHKFTEMRGIIFISTFNRRNTAESKKILTLYIYLHADLWYNIV